MNVKKTTYYMAMSLALLLTLLLGACSADGTDETAGQEHQLHLTPATRVLQEGDLTRSLPAGYEVLDVNQAFPNGKDLMAFIANSKNASEVFIRRLNYVTDWQKNISITDFSQPYSIYGFIPISDDTSDNVAISLLAGRTTYSDGVVMTVNNLKPLTVSDPCVIVGVKGYPSGVGSIHDVDVQLGKFDYSFSQTSTTDRVCMLLDHLFAKFQFKINVNATYDALRTIKVNKMTLQALDASGNVVNTVTATVNIVANESNISPVNGIQFSRSTAGSAASPYVLRDGELTLSTTLQDAGYCLAPYDQQYFLLTTEYDVYDKATPTPNKIRSGCTSTNKFTVSVESAKKKPGYLHTVQIMVTPTYLYVLSDPDFDNPTFTIQ